MALQGRLQFNSYTFTKVACELIDSLLIMLVVVVTIPESVHISLPVQHC